MPANEVRYEFDDVYAPDSKGYTLGVREIFFKIYNRFCQEDNSQLDPALFLTKIKLTDRKIQKHNWKDAKDSTWQKSKLIEVPTSFAFLKG